MVGLFGAAFLGWALGANDAANVFGPAVSARAVRYRTAVLLAAACVVLGAWLGSGRTLHTVANLGEQTARSALLVTTAAALAMTGLIIVRMPASSSQAVVGAILGAAWVRGSAVDPSILLRLVQGWLLTPLVALVLGFAGAMVLPRVSRFGVGLLVLDRPVRWALLGIGIWAAYALGANNAANVTGVYAASGLLTPEQAGWFAGISIGFGMVTFGWRLMDLVGRGLVQLDPPTALVTMLAQAATVHGFALWGIPVSASQALAGGALGIGLSKGVRTIGRPALRNVLLGWVLTPLGGFVMAVALGLLFGLR